jgi:hypothetical protein
MTLQVRESAPRRASAYTAAHAGAALRWFDTLRRPEEWNLTIDEQIELLGGVKKRTFQHWKSQALQGEEVELSRDTLERLSLLLGIYKGLRIIAPANRPDVAKQWFSTPNTDRPFNGQSPKQYLLARGSMDALYTVRRYLDAARGAA